MAVPEMGTVMVQKDGELLMTKLTWFAGLVFFVTWAWIIAEKAWLWYVAEEEKPKGIEPKHAAINVAAEFSKQLALSSMQDKLQDQYDDLSAQDNLTRAQEGYLRRLKEEIDNA